MEWYYIVIAFLFSVALFKCFYLRIQKRRESTREIDRLFVQGREENIDHFEFLVSLPESDVPVDVKDITLVDGCNLWVVSQPFRIKEETSIAKIRLERIEPSLSGSPILKRVSFSQFLSPVQISHAPRWIVVAFLFDHYARRQRVFLYQSPDAQYRDFQHNEYDLIGNHSEPYGRRI